MEATTSETAREMPSETVNETAGNDLAKLTVHVPLVYRYSFLYDASTTRYMGRVFGLMPRHIKYSRLSDPERGSSKATRALTHLWLAYYISIVDAL